MDEVQVPTIKISREYFSRISQIVNEERYSKISGILDNSLYYKHESTNKAEVTTALEMYGYCVVDFHDHKLQFVESWLNGILGIPFTDKNPGRAIHAKVQPEKNGKFYINSNQAQPVHTDEGHTRQLPKVVALYCAKAASYGGASILVGFSKLYAALQKKFFHLENLFNVNAINVKNVYGDESKPILFKLENGLVGISYSSVLQELSCDPETFAIFDFITSYVHDINNQIRFNLKVGQVLIFDNCRILHGRTSFPAGDDRLLYRYWFGNKYI